MPDDEQTDHRSAMLGVANGARMLMLMVPDLPDVISRAKRSLELSPFFDPTAYIQKGDDLRLDIQGLEAALPLWKWAQKMKAHAEGEAAGG